HATSEVCSENGLAAVGAGAGTRFVLFTAACISIVRSRLPRVRQYTHAIATEIAVVPKTYAGNDWPDLSVPARRKKGRCQHPQMIPTMMLAARSPTLADNRGT